MILKSAQCKMQTRDKKNYNLIIFHELYFHTYEFIKRYLAATHEIVISLIIDIKFMHTGACPHLIIIFFEKLFNFFA
jgi:hypothetical protein